MKRMITCAESMRAILAGRKSLTTRVVVPQPDEMGTKWAWSYHRRSIYGDAAEMAKFMAQHAPYHAGERVALTEWWSPWADELTKDVARASMFDDSLPVGPVIYAAEFVDGCSPLEVGGYGRWRPPFLMRAKDASVFVTITSVSAGRLHDMTYEDYVREGWDVRKSQPMTDRTAGEDARAWYIALWDRLNAKRGYPWETNPWVWHYGFEKEVRL